MRMLKKQWVVTMVIVALITFGFGRFMGEQLNLYLYPDTETAILKGKPINILFMGIDSRDANSNSRSDTMILASLDIKNNKVALISVPRDTRIVNDANRSQKINEINLFKGPEAACKAVANLLNVRVPYYVVTNFTGFVNIIDMLDGIDIEVEMDMVHPDNINPHLAINIKKGQQHLNGRQALNYVRYRGGATADIGRTQRQQKFVKAVLGQITKASNLLKLPQIVAEISESVNTNINTKDLVYLSSRASKFNSYVINSQTLPGYSFTDSKSGASYWEADKKIAKIIVDGLLRGETYKVASDSPIIPKKIPPPVEQEQINDIIPNVDDQVQVEHDDNLPISEIVVEVEEKDKSIREVEETEKSVVDDEKKAVTDNIMQPEKTDAPFETLPSNENQSTVQP